MTAACGAPLWWAQLRDVPSAGAAGASGATAAGAAPDDEEEDEELGRSVSLVLPQFLVLCLGAA